MENIWDTKFHNISIRYIDHLVQIKTDNCLRKYLRSTPSRRALELSKHIRKEYQNVMGKELKITQDSLAIEILLHVYIDDVAHLIEMLDKIFPAHIKKQLQSCAEKLKGHTEVIDSGETAIDPNRKVFDGLVPYKAFLYKVWG